MMDLIPKFIKPYLWSYDTTALDLARDKKLIVTQVLNYGTEQAIRWLFETYLYSDIAQIVMYPLPGQWDKKSLNYWALFFQVIPVVKPRFQT